MLKRWNFLKTGFYEGINLSPNETVLANVAVPLWGTGLDRGEVTPKARMALRLIGMENRMNYKPSQLSPKQRQVVAVARAVANDPAVIFADEPTWGLDTAAREEVLGLFQELNEQGKTVVIATSESGVASHCRRTVRMAEGRVVGDELVARRRVIPPSKRVARFQRETKADEVVCPRCNYGNGRGETSCQRCNNPLGGVGSSGGRAGGRRRLGEDAVEERIEELSKVPFLERLGSMGLAKLAQDLDPEQHAKGSRITKRGDPADSFYILRRGEVQVVLEGDDGAISPIANFGPSEGFGETGILTNQRLRSFSIVAATDVEVWSLPKKAFQTLLDEHPSLSRYFKQLVEQRFKMFQEGVHSSAEGQNEDDRPGPTAPPVQESATPRVGTSSVPARPSAIRTGDRLVPLERILGGGLPVKSLTMVVEVRESGKSVLCQHLTYGALLEGHGVAYFASEYTGESLVRQMDSLGLEVSTFFQENKLAVYATREPGGNEGPEERLDSLAVEIEDVSSQYGVIIVDDITDLATNSQEMAVIRFFASIRSLCQQGRTCIVASRSHAFDEPMLNRLETLCDAHLALGMEQVGARVANVLAVPKINNVQQRTANMLNFEVDRGSGMRILPVRHARI